MFSIPQVATKEKKKKKKKKKKMRTTLLLFLMATFLMKRDLMAVRHSFAEFPNLLCLHLICQNVPESKRVIVHV